MPTQRLVIDGDDKGHFSLEIHDGTLTVGADPAHAGIVLGRLRVVRIHCEVEVEEGPVVVGNDPTTPGAPPRGHELHAGEALHVGPAHLRLVVAPEAAGTAPASPPPTPTAVGKRLIVIDGADRGQSYPLADPGRTTIGNGPKHADIALHDLYVARIHCEVLIEGERVVVTHKIGRSGTLINGKEITEQEMQLGDILRVGNSHLRYEIGPIEPRAPRAPGDDRTTFAVSATARSGEAGSSEEEAAAAPAAGHTAATDALLQLEGRVLGQYQFGELLGRGLSGVVFRATHRPSNQAVGVKVLSPAFPADDAELQNFVRILKVVSPLRHAHLLAVFAAGKTAPYCWIVREYVEGESLRSVIARLQDEGKLGWKRACRVAVHLGKLLDFLETRGVAPGRLTPANILIQRDTRVTKLADVLLDQALLGSQLEKSAHEQRQLAELPYGAPELIEPGATADARSALYGLGAVLYALLTGQPPFHGHSPEEIIAQVREGKVVKPSKTQRDVPPPFEAAVLKLLARRPADRFQTAADLLAVVEPIANIHEIKV